MCIEKFDILGKNIWGVPKMGVPPNHPCSYLVGGLEHFLFSHILGIIIQLTNIFQRGSNHQPDIIPIMLGSITISTPTSCASAASPPAQALRKNEAFRWALGATPAEVYNDMEEKPPALGRPI